MEKVKLHDKEFVPFVGGLKLNEAISAVAKRINEDYKGKKPIFVGVLNGCFMFAADLMKQIKIECEISFVKMVSYQGMKSTGEFNDLIGLNDDVKGRDVIIVEDIVDTGKTLERLYGIIEKQNPASLETATLLFKPSAYQKNIKVKYVATEIPNNFVVGYGLDYDGLGRNLNELYILKE